MFDESDIRGRLKRLLESRTLMRRHPVESRPLGAAASEKEETAPLTRTTVLSGQKRKQPTNGNLPLRLSQSPWKSLHKDFKPDFRATIYLYSFLGKEVILSGLFPVRTSNRGLEVPLLRPIFVRVTDEATLINRLSAPGKSVKTALICRLDCTCKGSRVLWA